MNSIWNKNIRLFQTRFPQLAAIFQTYIKHFDSLAGTENESELYKFWKISKAKNGMPTAQENSIHIQVLSMRIKMNVKNQHLFYLWDSDWGIR